MYQWSSKDNKSKVLKDSKEAIKKNKDHMSPENIRVAKAQTMRGLGTDGISLLCDRKASNSFQ